MRGVEIEKHLGEREREEKRVGELERENKRCIIKTSGCVNKR